jgi:hypothetical protein
MGRFGGVSTNGSGRPTTSSIYGGHSGGKTILNEGGGGSGGSNGGGCSGCEPNVPFVTTLIEFVQILESLKQSINKYFPSMSIGSPIDSSFSIRGTMDIRTGARLEWIKRYRDRYGKFDAKNPLYINQLKDVFLSFGADWRIDKWLREWTPPDHIDCIGDATRSY